MGRSPAVTSPADSGPADPGPADPGLAAVGLALAGRRTAEMRAARDASFETLRRHGLLVAVLVGEWSEVPELLRLGRAGR